MSVIRKVATALTLSIIMSLCMAFFMTAKNMGFNDQFVRVWLTDSCVGVLVSLPLAYYVPERVQKLIGSVQDPRA
ncbi:MAG: DUF2798 domain-containing protein [Candidatus Methanoplasma sp.]|nr:DUF2798 domain-containing protein [Candidatus Methanoplasma sp.]